MVHFLRRYFLKRFQRSQLGSLCGARLSSQEAIKVQALTEETFGQPTPKSHPHLLKPGEVMPGIQLEEVVKRRERLVQEIIRSKGKINHLLIIPSATTLYMTEKIPYVFRQNSDFKYLTGCLEPDCLLLMFILSNGSHKSVLMTRDKNKHSELWEGPRTSASQAVKHFGVDEAYPMNELAPFLVSSLKALGNFNFWYDTGDIRQLGLHKLITSVLAETGPKEINCPKGPIHSLRLIKSEAEQALMAKSAKIASESINQAMKLCKPGVTEHQLFATVDYHCRMNGAEILAYPPVIAAGNNANTIHYINNTQEIHSGDMVLMDAGCELHGYCSDITRTWPANGKFSDAQRTLYEVVLSVQEDLIAKCADFPSLDKLLNEMATALGNRLAEAHVLTKETSSIDPSALAFKFCPHHVSHYLGMDVHDTGTIPRKVPIKEGMVITIEPGMYITPWNEFAHPEFRGCGIRVEDDVLITSSGPKVLSSSPKSVKDIETLCSK